MGVVVGIRGKHLELEYGTGSKGDLLEGVGMLEGVDVLEDEGDETDDVLGGGSGAQGVARWDGGINGADGDGEFGSDRSGTGATLVGGGGVCPTAGVTGGGSGEVGAGL